MNNTYFTPGNRIVPNRRIRNQGFDGEDNRTGDRRSNTGTDELALRLDKGIITVNHSPLLKYIGLDSQTTNPEFVGVITPTQYDLARNSINSMLVLPEEVRQGLYHRLFKPGPLKCIDTHLDISWNEVGHFNFPRLLVKVGKEALWVSNPVLRYDHAHDEGNEFLDVSNKEFYATLEKNLQSLKTNK